MKPPSVVSLGDAAVDIVMAVSKYPRLGGDDEITVMERRAGGSAANFSVAVSRLGIGSGFIGKIGADDAGDCLREDFRREGVDISHLHRSAARTGTVIVIVDRSSQRTMLSYRGANVQLTPQEIPREYIAGAKWLHVSGYSLVHAPQSHAALKAMRYARDAGISVSLDPSPHVHLAKLGVVAKALRLANVLLPNETEVKYLSGKKTVREGGRSLLRKGVSTVTIKLGSQGSLVMTKGRESRVPAFNVKTIDTTGAGDAYDAGFVVGRLRGWDLKQTSRFANAVAALKTTKIGARDGLPRLPELEKFMRNEQA